MRDTDNAVPIILLYVPTQSVCLYLASASIQADDLNLGLALVQPLVLLNLLRQQSLGSCASGRLRTAFARGQLVEASLVFAATFG